MIARKKRTVEPEYQSIHVKGRDRRGHLCSVTYGPYDIDHITIVGGSALIYVEPESEWRTWRPVTPDLTISMSDYRRIKSLLRPKVVIIGDDA